jgi:HD-GYP domain-containing protein (c-di-GMP phosphodiesterase class II)
MTLMRSLNSRNPRIIREWIDHERATALSSALLGCLDAAIEVQLAGIVDSDVQRLAERVREEARSYVAGTTSVIEVSGSSTVSNICDGMVLAMRSVSTALYDHSVAVESLAVRLGKILQLAEEQLDRVRFAARIHELGRLRVSGLLRGSQDVFNDEQRESYRASLARLDVASEEMLLQPIADIVYEMFMASLATASEESQVLRVSDAMVSLCEPRERRPAYPVSRALEILWANGGGRFNLHVVEALASLFGFQQQRFAKSA